MSAHGGQVKSVGLPNSPPPLVATHAASEIGIRLAYRSGFLLGVSLSHRFRLLFQCFQRQADAFAFLIDFQNLEFLFITDLQDFSHAADSPPRQFADMNKSFDARFQFDERAKVRDSPDSAVHDAFLMDSDHLIPARGSASSVSFPD